MRTTAAQVEDHYLVHDLSAGIVWAEARPTGTALSNAAVADLGGPIVLFDTSLSLRSAGALRNISESHLGASISLVVNSHWHLDHILGNQAFGKVPIYGTHRTIEILRERRTDLSSEISAENLRAVVEDLERKLREASTEYARGQYGPALRLHVALLEESSELRIVPPSEGFDRELRLPGDRRAVLYSFGSGHTESDAILFLPGERVLFAGDLVVNGHHPNLCSGDPEHWLEVLREIERLRPERIVPGHGPLASAESVTAIADYIGALLELAREGPSPTIPSRFASWEGPEQFVENMAFLRSRVPPRK